MALKEFVWKDGKPTIALWVVILGVIVVIIVSLIVAFSKPEPKPEQSEPEPEPPKPTYLTMKSSRYGCPAQTFELVNNPPEGPHWKGPNRILNVDKDTKKLVCATSRKTVATRGYYTYFDYDDGVCYHVEKDIKKPDGSLDEDKCVPGPTYE